MTDSEYQFFRYSVLLQKIKTATSFHQQLALFTKLQNSYYERSSKKQTVLVSELLAECACAPAIAIIGQCFQGFSLMFMNNPG